MTPLVPDGDVRARAPEERDRLDTQGALYREVTRRTLIEDGIGPVLNTAVMTFTRKA